MNCAGEAEAHGGSETEGKGEMAGGGAL